MSERDSSWHNLHKGDVIWVRFRGYSEFTHCKVHAAFENLVRVEYHNMRPGRNPLQRENLYEGMEYYNKQEMIDRGMSMYVI